MSHFQTATLERKEGYYTLLLTEYECTNTESRYEEERKRNEEKKKKPSAPTSSLLIFRPFLFLVEIDLST